jgi:hypothetical protein
MVKNIAKHLRRKYHYDITGAYWGRIGKVVDRYGEETILKAIAVLPERDISLTTLLNIIERKCQWIIENGELGELENDLLNKE